MKKLILLICTLLTTTLLWAEKPIVQNIQASVGKGTKIHLSWTLPQNPESPVTSLLVYRSNKPITSYKQIVQMTPIQVLSGDVSSYTDSVSDYNDYFYAVISFTDKVYDLVLVSVNSTVNGVHLSMPKITAESNTKPKEEKLYEEGTLRETPLPYLDILSTEKEESKLSNDAINSAKNLAKSTASETEILFPYFFEEDLVSPDGGDEYILFEILKNTFVQEKYSEANSQLRRLVNRNINKDVMNRSYFYIGEAEYFLGNYEEAIKAFIQVYDYPLQTKKWINATLSKMTVDSE